jgi:hypothetical protein
MARRVAGAIMSGIDQTRAGAGPVAAAPGETRVAWPLRAWFGVEIFFGLASSFSVFLSPHATASNFAWPIQPAVTAAVFGAVYFSALLLMIASLFTPVWERARVVVLPAAVFTAVMLLPTFLHLDRFSTGSIAFVIWLASYVLPPPVFVACFVWQQRRTARIGSGGAASAPLPGRWLLLANGALLTTFCIAVMAFPAILQAIAPIAFTPLTARAFAGYVTLVALLQISMAVENDRLRSRLATVLLIPLPFAVLFQLVRYGHEVRWSNAALWVFLLDLAVVAALGAGLWLRPSAARVPPQ